METLFGGPAVPDISKILSSFPGIFTFYKKLESYWIQQSKEGCSSMTAMVHMAWRAIQMRVSVDRGPRYKRFGV